MIQEFQEGVNVKPRWCKMNYKPGKHNFVFHFICLNHNFLLKLDLKTVYNKPSMNVLWFI